MSSSALKVAVFGLGNFGYALFRHLDSRLMSGDLDFTLIGYDKDQADVDFMRQQRHPPRHLTDYLVSAEPLFTNSVPELLDQTSVLVLAVSGSALPTVLDQIKPHLSTAQSPLTILSVIKAVNPESALTPSQIITRQLGEANYQVAALAGGTIATSLAAGNQVLGVTLASEKLATLRQLQVLFQSPQLRCQLSLDLLGVELASSLKNLISVLTGIVTGLGFEYGTTTFLLSKIATECQQLSQELGAASETFVLAAQCWGNDMIMSTTGQTRNHEFGQLVAQLNSFTRAEAQMTSTGKTVESVNTLRALPQLLAQVDHASRWPLLNFAVALSRDQVQPDQLPAVLRSL